MKAPKVIWVCREDVSNWWMLVPQKHKNKAVSSMCKRECEPRTRAACSGPVRYSR